MGSTLNKLYIGNNTPIPIEQKWPNFVSSKYFTVAKNHFYNSFTAIDSVGQEYLLITTKNVSCNCVGATYNIDKKRTYRGRTYYNRDDQVLLSSNELSKFYALHKEKGNLYISQYYFTDKEIPTSRILPVEHDGDFPIFFPICAVGKNQILVVRHNDQDYDCGHVDWPVLNGFVSDGKFYLFGSNYIITFPQKVYTEPNQPVNFERIPFNDFIQCGGDVDVNKPRDVAVAKRKYFKWN